MEPDGKCLIYRTPTVPKTYRTRQPTVRSSAIRPDRDKTGRQKNPRRSMMMMSPVCSLTGKKYSDASLIGDFTSLEANLADLQDSEDNRTTPSSRADSNDEEKVRATSHYYLMQPLKLFP